MTENHVISKLESKDEIPVININLHQLMTPRRINISLNIGKKKKKKKRMTSKKPSETVNSKPFVLEKESMILLAKLSGQPSRLKTKKSNTNHKFYDMSVLERGFLWQQHKTFHLRELVEKKRQDEMQECTFWPDITRKSYRTLSTCPDLRTPRNIAHTLNYSTKKLRKNSSIYSQA